MGLNLDQMWESAKQAITQTGNDLVDAGKPALIGYLEDQAVKILQADKQQHEANFQASVASILNRPTATDSLGAYISNAAQSPVIKQYGPYILLAGLLIFGAAVLIGRK